VTREQSWEVEGDTLAVLRGVAALRFTLSVFRFPSSRLGTRPACVEMPAVDLSTTSPTQHVARVADGEGAERDARCANIAGGDGRAVDCEGQPRT
jgi:hypothetical protein